MSLSNREVLITIVVIALIGAAVAFIGYESERSWQEFARVNECHITEKRESYRVSRSWQQDGQTVYGSETHPARTVWTCAGGVIYER